MNQENYDKELERIKNTIEYKKISNISRDSKYLSLLSIIILFITFIYGTFNINKLNKETNILEEKKDSLLNLNKDLEKSAKKFELQISKKNKVIDFISAFLSEIKTDENINQFYAEKVDRYYLRKNLNLKQIMDEKKQFNTINPKSKVTFKRDDIIVDLKKDNTSEVYVNVLYFPDSLRTPKEIIYQIKLDSLNKVYYVRNLESKNH